MMNNSKELHPVEMLILGMMLLIESAAVVLVMMIALMMALANYCRPWPPSPTPMPAPAAEPVAPWLPPILQELEPLTVAELRRLARAAGLPRSLSRSGRRAELLPAVAGAAMAW
jgi:hypothetical protein